MYESLPVNIRNPVDTKTLDNMKNLKNISVHQLKKQERSFRWTRNKKIMSQNTHNILHIYEIPCIFNNILGENLYTGI